MEMFIYTLSDPITNEVKYVGQTKNMKDRLQRHMRPSNLKQSWQPKVKWILYLKQNNLKPIMELLDVGDKTNIDDLERYWISQFKSWGFKLKNGNGGGQFIIDKGSKLSESHLENVKKASKNKKPIPHSAYDNLRKSVIQYTLDGKFVEEYESVSDATRKTGFSHISSCCNGKRNYVGVYYFRFKDNDFPYKEKENHWLGKKHKEESVEKMKMNHPLRRCICQYNIDTDELIETFLSSHDASDKTGFNRYNIMSCCKGRKSFNTVGGYYFRYEDDYFPRVKNIKNN